MNECFACRLVNRFRARIAFSSTTPRGPLGPTVVALLVGMAVAVPTEAGFWDKLRRKEAEHQPPADSVEAIACMIDEIESFYGTFGAIAIKSPDVWAENRTAGHRAEFEAQMKTRVDDFVPRVNALIRRSDAAAFMSQTALAAAVNGATAPTVPTNQAVAVLGTQSTVRGLPTATALPDLALSAKNTIGLEPTLVLDQETRYINHLHQLRRLNAGDDRVDLPGYALHLVRLPVSLLPGPKTRNGRGGMVTFQASHNLPADLLDTTFRQLVIVDVVNQLAPAVLALDHQGICDDKNISCTACASSTARSDSHYVGLLPVKAEMRQESMTTGPAIEMNPDASFANGGTLPHGAISPASELLCIYGQNHLCRLVKAIQEYEKQIYHHDPTAISFLYAELAAADQFMRTQAKSGDALFLPETFELLGSLVERRCYQQLAIERDRFINQVAECRRHGLVHEVATRETQAEGICARPSAVDVLVYALAVQRYLLNKQLHEDMETVAARTGASIVACHDFHAMIPDPTASLVFNEYVAAKWPIHVFTLDPANETQNELDVFSQRSDLQLALAVAVANGKVNFNQAMSYARRIEMDQETVGLNRTVVGFGAGESTFGWKFFPRIQTPPIQSNPSRMASLFVWGAPAPNFERRKSELEPGSRECVALILLPDFVPRLNVFATAEWFDLVSHCDDRILSTRQVLEYSRQVQSAKQYLEHVCNPGDYRPGEIERLAARLGQLEDKLPTQTFTVPVPTEIDLGGSDVFTSSQSNLSPRLLAWYGEPVKQGEESTIFLYGTGFRVYETQVIAGSQPILCSIKCGQSGAMGEGSEQADIESSPKALLMSKNIMRITIPASARATTREGDGRRVIDIHLATPHGISNHLLVECEPVAVAAASSAGCGYKLNKEEVRIGYFWAQSNTGPELRFCGETELKIDPLDCNELKTAKAKVELSFGSKKPKLDLGSREMAKDLWKEFRDQLLVKISGDGLLPGDSIGDLTLGDLTVTPESPAGLTLNPMKSKPKFKVVFVKVDAPCCLVAETPVGMDSTPSLESGQTSDVPALPLSPETIPTETE